MYRLTLVKSWNMTEVDEYVTLIKRGMPDFIEIKVASPTAPADCAQLTVRRSPYCVFQSVTYCGKSDGSSLTMGNVPYHQEVRNFSEAICAKLGDEYGMACEHSHSNLVLVAKTKFKVDGVWHTWINYPRFHELVAAYKRDGTPFSSMDYIAPTPEVGAAAVDLVCTFTLPHPTMPLRAFQWAVYNATEEGFDPVETRFKRSKTGKVVEIGYKASSSGCG